MPVVIHLSVDFVIDQTQQLFTIINILTSGKFYRSRELCRSNLVHKFWMLQCTRSIHWMCLCWCKTSSVFIGWYQCVLQVECFDWLLQVRAISRWESRSRERACRRWYVAPRTAFSTERCGRRTPRPQRNRRSSTRSVKLKVLASVKCLYNVMSTCLYRHVFTCIMADWWFNGHRLHTTLPLHQSQCLKNYLQRQRYHETGARFVWVWTYKICTCFTIMQTDNTLWLFHNFFLNIKTFPCE